MHLEPLMGALGGGFLMTNVERVAKLVVETIKDNRQMGVYTREDWIEENLQAALELDGVIKPVEVWYFEKEASDGSDDAVAERGDAGERVAGE